MEQMQTFSSFLFDHPEFWDKVDDDGIEFTIYASDGSTVLYSEADIIKDLEEYYGTYYINRDLLEMIAYFKLQKRNFMRNGWQKLLEVYNDIDIQNLLYEFLRESETDGKSWNRNRPLNLVNDETSATSTNGFENNLLDKGYNKNQVSQFKKLVEDFKNIYKAYIYSFGYIFCEVF